MNLFSYFSWKNVIFTYDEVLSNRGRRIFVTKKYPKPGERTEKKDDDENRSIRMTTSPAGSPRWGIYKKEYYPENDGDVDLKMYDSEKIFGLKIYDDIVKIYEVCSKFGMSTPPVGNRRYGTHIENYDQKNINGSENIGYPKTTSPVDNRRGGMRKGEKNDSDDDDDDGNNFSKSTKSTPPVDNRRCGTDREYEKCRKINDDSMAYLNFTRITPPVVNRCCVIYVEKKDPISRTRTIFLESPDEIRPFSAGTGRVEKIRGLPPHTTTPNEGTHWTKKTPSRPLSSTTSLDLTMTCLQRKPTYPDHVTNPSPPQRRITTSRRSNQKKEKGKQQWTNEIHKWKSWWNVIVCCLSLLSEHNRYGPPYFIIKKGMLK